MKTLLSRLTRIGVLAACAVAPVLTGCVSQSVIRHPPAVNAGNPATVINPVSIDLDWSNVQYRSGEPYVLLDGNNVTASFGGGIQCCVSASSVFTLTPGRHTVQVGVPRNATLGTHIEVLPFDVVDPSFGISLAPASLTLLPGATAVSTATITTTGGFNGQVSLSVTRLPPGTSATVTPSGTGTQRINVAAATGAPGGQATAMVTGTAPCGPSCGGPATTTVAAPLTITVTGPGIGISGITPANVIVPRGGSTAVTVQVTRIAGFAGAADISVSGLPAGVTAAPARLAAGATSATVTLTASRDAGLAAVATGTAPPTRTVALNMTGVCTPACPAIAATGNFNARVGRRVGAFSVAAPDLKNAPSTATSSDGRIGLVYALANPQPPGATQFTATYNRIGSPGQLQAINLQQSPIDWGAGLCAADPSIAGVVLSGTYGGITNAPIFYTLPIWSPASGSSAARAFTLPVHAINTDAGTTILPRLWYSPDCTLAAFVHSSFAPSPPAALTIVDMTTGQAIATPINFAGATPSRIEVVATAGGQQVQVQFSPTDVRNVAIP